jgi:NodT family efflux transporter outer membrane factor (OMF) lipoprotein
VVYGCRVEVKEVPIPIKLPQQFSRSGHYKLPQKWWHIFEDPALNTLIEHALSQNFSLRSAFNRVEQARALAKKSGASLQPTLDAKFNPARKITDKLTTQSFSLGLIASYEVDLWGRIRANLQAAELDFKSIEEDLQSAALTLSAEISNNWYRLIEQRQQLQLLDRQIKVNSNQYAVLKSQFKAAQASAADVLQQQQLLESVKGNKSSVFATIKVLEHQLSILLGEMPTTFHLPIITTFPAIPQLPKTGVPLELVQRRPDIRKAYFKVQAANQKIAAAIADRFPKISLSAGLDTSVPNLQSLFNNWIATLAGNLILPLIDGQRREAEVTRTRAVAREALNNYAQQLLNAVAEIENALNQQQYQHQLLISLKQQYRLAQQANEQIKWRYRYGDESFLRVLSSTISQQNLERSQLQAQRQLMEHHIALYRALSGSFPSLHRK